MIPTTNSIPPYHAFDEAGNTYKEYQGERIDPSNGNNTRMTSFISEIDRCKYKTGRCPHTRAVKRNGSRLLLCEYHRLQQNRTKKRSDMKYRENRARQRALLKQTINGSSALTYNTSMATSSRQSKHKYKKEKESLPSTTPAMAADHILNSTYASVPNHSTDSMDPYTTIPGSNAHDINSPSRRYSYEREPNAILNNNSNQFHSIPPTRSLSLQSSHSSNLFGRQTQRIPPYTQTPTPPYTQMTIDERQMNSLLHRDYDRKDNRVLLPPLLHPPATEFTSHGRNLLNEESSANHTPSYASTSNHPHQYNHQPQQHSNRVPLTNQPMGMNDTEVAILQYFFM